MSNQKTVSAAPGAAASGNVTSESAFGQVSASSTRVVCAVPSSYNSTALDGKQLELRAGILITGGTTTNYAPSVRFNSGSNTNLTTFTSDTAIITPSAFAVNSVTRLFTLRAMLVWDVTTARLNGSYSFNADNAFTTWTTLTAGLTTGVATSSAIQFLITGFFSATNAANTAILKYFELDLL